MVVYSLENTDEKSAFVRVVQGGAADAHLLKARPKVPSEIHPFPSRIVSCYGCVLREMRRCEIHAASANFLKELRCINALNFKVAK